MKRGKNIRQSTAISVILLGLLFTLPLLALLPSGEKPEEEPPEPFVPGARDQATILKVLDGEEVREMSLGEYLVGVVRAEMPASFEPEALKAQATAARTYTLYKMRTGGNHGDKADICTDFSCCQAYISEERARKNWGENADAYQKKIETAVQETDGMTILYDQVPILAVFHSSSAGQTRNSGSVWVNDLPYLQSVSSPEDQDHIPNYYSRMEIPVKEFQTKFLAKHPEAQLTGEAKSWLKDPVKDSAGSVEQVTVGGVKVRGAELRSILGLRSACFDWEVQGEKLVFFVTGFGHGVGMSQYGANQMAKEGADYQEILTHYYTGVTVAPYQPGG